MLQTLQLLPAHLLQAAHVHSDSGLINQLWTPLWSLHIMRDASDRLTFHHMCTESATGLYKWDMMHRKLSALFTVCYLIKDKSRWGCILLC